MQNPTVNNTFLTPRRPAAALSALFCLLLLAPLCLPARAQSIDLDRDRGREMLKAVKGDIKKNYYDPYVRGIDLETRFRQAEEEVKQAKSLGQITAAIAQALLDLNDSHTFFLPPAQTTRVEYGWQMQMFGPVCYVVAVNP